MFKLESEMIPILQRCLAQLYKTKYFVVEFSTGNGIADIVFTTDFNEESLIIKNYKMMSVFINQINGKKKLKRKELLDSSDDKKKLLQLFHIL